MLFGNILVRVYHYCLDFVSARVCHGNRKEAINNGIALVKTEVQIFVLASNQSNLKAGSFQCTIFRMRRQLMVDDGLSAEKVFRQLGQVFIIRSPQHSTHAGN